MKNEGKTMLDEASRTASGVVQNIRDTAGDFANRAGEVASDIASKAGEYSETAIEETSGFIRRYPAQTLLAGFGLGLLVGFVVSRR